MTYSTYVSLKSIYLACCLPPTPSSCTPYAVSSPFFTRSQTPLGRWFGICLATGCVSLKCSTCHLVLHKRKTRGKVWGRAQVGFAVFVAFSISVSLSPFASLSALCQAGHDWLCLWFGVEFVAATATETVFRTPPPIPLYCLYSDMPGMPRARYEYQFWRQLLALTNFELRLHQSHLTAFAPRLTRLVFDFGLDFCWCQSNIPYHMLKWIVV